MLLKHWIFKTLLKPYQTQHIGGSAAVFQKKSKFLSFCVSLFANLNRVHIFLALWGLNFNVLFTEVSPYFVLFVSSIVVTKQKMLQKRVMPPYGQ